MGAVLARTVTAGGVVFPAGTEETPELRAVVRNPRAWTGDTELELPEPTATGPVDVAEQIAAAVETAVALAKDELREELLDELSAQLQRQVAAIPLAEVTDATSDPASAPAEPPRGGRGSGEDVWRAYAGQLGVDVTAASDRDGIIALVDQYKAAGQ